MTEQTKLRALLLGLWLLLLLPTLFLGYQTYQRLQFESLHQYRTLAETLTDGVAGALALAVQQESARAPQEYSYEFGGNRSPLAALAPTSGLPGLVGYFQVDALGALSSPVMPLSSNLGDLSVEELTLRQLKLRSIENALLAQNLDLPQPSAVPADDQLDAAASPVVPAEMESAADLAEADVAGGAGGADGAYGAPPSAVQYSVPATREADEDALGAIVSSPNAQRNQILYEELSQADKPSLQRNDRQKASAARELKLDTEFFSQSNRERSAKAATRVSKKQARSEPKPSAKDRKAKVVPDDVQALPDLPSIITPPASIDAAVGASIFGSTVSEFGLRTLSTEHLLLLRRVWGSGQPLVQGLVLDRQQFFAGAITSAYQASALAEVSDLAVAVDGDVQLTLAAGQTGYSAGARLSGGELLYRRYLGTPFGNVEMLFSARELPLAAGASLVLWTLLVLVALLCAGFVLLYRLGKRQLEQRQQQQDFVSAVSHELKTPLTSIRMYGEMLKSGWVDEAKKSEYYDYIFNESERLSRLINNVLQLSSITRGRDELQLGSMSVAHILDLVRSRSAAQIAAQGYVLNIVCDPELESTQLVVDEDALLQVMINLIDNALKFSQGCERQELLLEVSRDGDAIEFGLRDYGPGIERDQLSKIFELFYRSENELTRETVGTGIGLALVQELVGAMGGRIRAQNCEPGAEFLVRLPA